MSALERTLAHGEKCVKTYTKASPLALTTKGKRKHTSAAGAAHEGKQKKMTASLYTE